MQPGPLIGMVIAFVAIVFGNVLEGGHLSSLLGGPAALIVLGGTIGAVFVQYPVSSLKAAAGAAGRTFRKPAQEPRALIEEIVGYANQARLEGILGLEKVASNASDPFLSKALMMAIDGADSTALRETMEIIIDQGEEHGEEAAKVFEAAGGYSPTIGIIGAVLGLIHVMSNLADINAVGHGIAAAFVATIYGVGVANILFLPLGGRIKIQVREASTTQQLTLVGVLAIQEGMNPKLVRERLSAFLHEGGSKEH